jgi:hypothetical protein
MRVDRRAGPLARHRVPVPPPELAAKVLTAAAMVGVTQATPSWVDRLWESSRVRLLWATTLAALLLGHALAARTPSTPVPTSTGGVRVVALLTQLDLPSPLGTPAASRFRVPSFHGYQPVAVERERIERALAEVTR